MADLDPGGGTVRVGRLTMRAPDLSGTANPRQTRRGRTSRGPGGPADSVLEAGLDSRDDIRTTDVVDVSTRQRRRPRAGQRGPGSAQRGALTLEVPPPEEGHEQAVLSIDERGIVSWSFAPREERGVNRRARTRGGGDRTFVIPRPPAPEPAGGATSRSVGGAIVKQVLKVITFPIGKAAGKVANTFIERWEEQHLRYGIRDYLPANYRTEIPYFDGNPGRWTQLAQGRTLLMIHGTFSRALGAFDELPPERMAQLDHLYGGRIIAFDHHTISASPRENIEKLLSMMPANTSLDIDIICHSRGGLVARSLTEWQGDFPDGRDIRVHRTALVGTVNNGTILADVHHWNQLIDMLSTLLNTVGVAVAEPIDLIVSIAQDIAEAGYPELRGLYAMVPDGPFLNGLNQSRPRLSRYLAIASNYEPIDGRIQSYINDTVKDLIFERNDNDCMVRVDSVCGSEGAGQFPPVEDKLLLGSKAGVEHSRYFGNPEVADRLETWLGAGLP